MRKTYPNINITSHSCDVTKSNQVDKLFNDINEKHKNHLTARIIVNSAGVGPKTSILDLSESEFDEVIAINLKGTHLVTRAAIKQLVEAFPKFKFENEIQSYASIINLSSQAAKGSMSPHYASSKAAVLAYSKSIARELGKYRIRSNSILPYFIETPMINVLNQKEEKILKNIVPLRRFGRAEEVAELCLFLASDASSYINATGIDINGGVMA